MRSSTETHHGNVKALLAVTADDVALRAPPKRRRLAPVLTTDPFAHALHAQKQGGRELVEAAGDLAGAARCADRGRGSHWCGATLVVCPLVAVIQWRNEIARYTTPGTLKVRLGFRFHLAALNVVPKRISLKWRGWAFDSIWLHCMWSRSAYP